MISGYAGYDVARGAMIVFYEIRYGDVRITGRRYPDGTAQALGGYHIERGARK